MSDVTDVLPSCLAERSAPCPNAVLVVLEGADGPIEWVLKMPAVNDGWPSLEQCELVVRCERMEDE